MKKVFLLEDDPKRIKWFKATFINVDHADNPIDGLKMLEENSDYGMIFLDHDLGGEQYVDSADPTTGMQLAKWMAEKSLHLDTPIIIHSLNYGGAVNMESVLKSHKDVKRINYATLKKIVESENGVS